MARKSKPKSPKSRVAKRKTPVAEAVGCLDPDCLEAGCLENDCRKADHGPSDVSGASADRQLVDRCLAGEVKAWEELYHQCHGPLCAAIKSLIIPDRDPNLIDEMAACVWYALVKNDGEMLERFDPSRDLRLTTFLRGLARIEVMQYFRAEQRRRLREAAAGGPSRNTAPLSDCQIDAMLNEFVSTLTISEQQFLEQYLLTPPQDGEDADCTDVNIWQRRRRIRVKLLAYLRGD